MTALEEPQEDCCRQKLEGEYAGVSQAWAGKVGKVGGSLGSGEAQERQAGSRGRISSSSTSGSSLHVGIWHLPFACGSSSRHGNSVFWQG